MRQSRCRHERRGSCVLARCSRNFSFVLGLQHHRQRKRRTIQTIMLTASRRNNGALMTEIKQLDVPRIPTLSALSAQRTSALLEVSARVANGRVSTTRIFLEMRCTNVLRPPSAIVPNGRPISRTLCICRQRARPYLRRFRRAPLVGRSCANDALRVARVASGKTLLPARCTRLTCRR